MLCTCCAAAPRGAVQLSDVNVGREMQRSLVLLVRAITLEALGLGASVAGGAQAVLQGTAPPHGVQPANISGARHEVRNVPCGRAWLHA